MNNVNESHFNVQFFSEKLKEAMKRKGLVNKKGRPDSIQLYNAFYPNDRLSNNLEGQALRDKARKFDTWLKGTSYPKSVSDIVTLCNILDCSMDFLFSDISDRNYDIKYIKDMTGLSEKAIDILHDDVVELETLDFLVGNTSNDYTYGEKLSPLLSNHDFWLLLCSLQDYQKATREFNEAKKGLAPNQYWNSKNYLTTSEKKDIATLRAQQYFFSLLDSIIK